MRKTIALYDNNCSICIMFAQFLQKCNYLNYLELLPLHSEGLKIAEEGLGFNYQMASEQIAVLHKGKWHYGYDGLWFALKLLTPFWLLLPFLWLLKVSFLGQWIYKEFAQRRTIVSLHCSNGCKVPKKIK